MVTFVGLRRAVADAKAAEKPQIIRHITKPMMRRLKVRYSAYPTRITNVERDKIRTWMLAMLASPTLSGATWPDPNRRIVIYSDGIPSWIEGGSWRDNKDGHIFLAGHSLSVPPLERVAILATLARVTQLNDEPDIMTAVTEATVKYIKTVITPVWDGLVIAAQRPDMFAFNIATYEVAAQLNDKWYLPSGQPVKVDDKWTIMEF